MTNLDYDGDEESTEVHHGSTFKRSSLPRSDFDITYIHVELDNWFPGSDLMFYGHMGRIHKIYDCPKSVEWTPLPSVTIAETDALRAEYTNRGCHQADYLVTWDDIWRLAKYRRGDCYVEVKQKVCFGTITAWVEIRMPSMQTPWTLRATVGFASSEDCVRFIHDGVHELERKHKEIITSRIRSARRDKETVNVNMARSPYENGSTVIDDIRHAIYERIPFAYNRACAWKDAVARQLLYFDFIEQSPDLKLEAKIVPHRAIASPRGPSNPCILAIDLNIETWVDDLGVINSFINRVGMTLMPNLSAFPSPSSSFRSLNDISLSFSPASDDRSHSTSPRDRESLTVNISARQISFLSGTNSVSSSNSFTVDSEHRTVIINYIAGDAFFGPIHGGNIGGRNNNNVIRNI